MAHCPAYQGPICSLCCTLDARCGDLCKPHASLSAQWSAPCAAAAAPRLALPRHRPGPLPAADAGDRAAAGRAVRPAVPPGAQALPRASEPGAGWCKARCAVSSRPTSRCCCCGRHRRLVAGAGAQEPAGGAGGIEPPDAFADARDRAHRQTDEALQQAKQVAEEARNHADQANQAKSRYISAISHELRTPLNSILGYAQLMGEDSAIPPHRKQAVNVIRRGGEHLLSLIEGTLDIARIEAGKLTLERQAHALCRLHARDGRHVRAAGRRQGPGLPLRDQRRRCRSWCAPTRSGCGRS
jgi:hypothetical protein